MWVLTISTLIHRVKTIAARMSLPPALNRIVEHLLAGIGATAFLPRCPPCECVCQPSLACHSVEP
eukprot:6397469-Amphidinium_carterae.1